MQVAWTSGMRWIAAATLALTALFAVGCTSGATNQPAAGNQTLVYVTSALPLGFDPCFTAGSPTAEIMTNLYASWTRYKVGNQSSGQLGDITATGEQAMQSGLIESWKQSSDGLTYTLNLRQGLKDAYGNLITADDALWSIQRISQVGGCSFVTANMGITKSTNLATRLAQVNQHVSVTGPNTLRVTLDGPAPIFLRMFAVGNGSFVGPEARKHATTDDPWATTWLKTNADATGPYQLQSYTPGVEVVLTRNPNYYGPKPAIAKVIYKEVDSDATRTAILLGGQAQVARDLSQDELDQIGQSKKAYTVCPIANYMLNLTPNAVSGPTANSAVRRALAYAIPYESIIQSVYRNRATRQYGMAPSIYPDFLGQSSYPYQTDLAQAKQMLAAAGFPSGFDATVVISNTSPEQEATAILLQNSFKQIGVNLSIDSEPFAKYTSITQQHSFPNFALWNINSLVIDYGYHASLFLNPGAPPNFNYGSWKQQEFDGLLSQVPSMAPTDRKAATQRMQEIFNQELPYIPIATIAQCTAFQKGVSGYVWHTTNQVFFADLKMG